jgi:hypothetical protein
MCDMSEHRDMKQPLCLFVIGKFWNRIYCTVLHLPPLSFDCVGGCWDRTQDSYDFGIRC